MFKRCKVVIVPKNINEKARPGQILWFHPKGKLKIYELEDVDITPTWMVANLYILSDDEIKDGDYYYDDLVSDWPNVGILQMAGYANSEKDVIQSKVGTTSPVKTSHKVIATTDPNLLISEFAKTKCRECGGDMKVNLPDHLRCVKCGVTSWNLITGMYNEVQHFPSPSQSFIEKYVTEYNKGNIITEVLVEYIDFTHNQYSGANAQWTEWIPKIGKDNTITIRKIKDSCSREEVEKLLLNYREHFRECLCYHKSPDEPKEWLEKNL